MAAIGLFPSRIFYGRVVNGGSLAICPRGRHAIAAKDAYKTFGGNTPTCRELSVATPQDKFRQVEGIVVDFITKDAGHFLVAGNDSVFNSVLRGTMNKQLAITTDCVTVVNDQSKILKEVNELIVRRKRLVVFLERQLNQSEASFLVRQLKNAFTDIKSSS